MPITAAAVAAGAQALQAAQGFFGGSAAQAASARQFEYNLALQKQQQEWNEYAYKNRYQWQVNDLEKAGINKLYGIGSAPNVTSGLNSTGMGDDVGEKNGRMQQFLQGMSIATDWSAKKAQIAKTEAETKTEKIREQLLIAEKLGQEADNILKNKDIDSYDERKAMELKKQASEIRKNAAQEAEAYAAAENNREQASSARTQSKLVEEQTKTEQERRNNMKSTTKQVDNIVEGLERTNKWHKEHPILSGIATAANELKNFNDTTQGYIKNGVDIVDTVNKNKNPNARSYYKKKKK